MKQRVQIILLIAICIAAIRVAWIFYERRQNAAEPAKKEGPALDADYYVTPKKLFPYDLKSAKQQLTQKPAWVKVGYAYGYFAYDRASRHADLAHEAGKLGPIQKIEIKDVVTAPSQRNPGQKEVLAVFENEGKWYTTAIGTEEQGTYQFWMNDMLFFQDPHDLYKHWPGDVWQAVDQHQVKQGMSELQADFAVGIGLLQPGGDSNDRTLDYPNGGKPLKVSFHEGKAVQISAGPQG